MAENDTSLYPPSLRVKSEVWKYFGYRKNADGSICDNGFPVCKKCGRQVAAQGRNTSNMFSHLRSNHPIQFREIRKISNKFRSALYRARVTKARYLAERKDSSDDVEMKQESAPVYFSSENEFSSVTHNSPERNHSWVKQEPKNEIIEWNNIKSEVPAAAERDVLSSAISTTTPAEALPTCDMLAFTKMKCLLENKQEKIDTLEKQVQDLQEDRKFLRTQIENLTSTLSGFVREGVTRRFQET
ncbi:uncharacterized protein LOC130412943 isoform X1 [Triplophysa dalaica]|uniref:uncharacterized protein LOC130412943 isoform X1 n=1 Tax=Triplophysa dalaica TaxID=1582913 RepID=UPI0024DFB784|nr:uncharacterized protein LOC130412943 isoform X1 [Triplophysa dalaica]